MPRFFFDVADARDKTGADLPDPEAARAYAIGLAATLLRGRTLEAETGQSTVTIRDEADEVIDTVTSERG